MGSKTRIFFTTDVHGSEKTFRKFISAGKFYKANVLILGGDLTGKLIIPIVRQPDGRYKATFLGEERVVKDEKELEDIEKLIRFSGYYLYRTSPDEVQELSSDETKLDELFKRLVTESMERWVRLCEEHLRGTGIKCFIQSGNDDRKEVSKILCNSDCVINPEGKAVWVDEHHEMISTGHANITPFDCPGDVPEDELARKIDEMASKVKDMENCIFNFHCPPHGSGLDLAPKLDKTLKPVVPPEEIPAGSMSVLKAIERHQPLLGLHGHIHESRGAVRIGRTLCINPGSEYGEGVLRGVIIDLTEKDIASYLLTSG
jgi:Icc-related predicted phosphoesterase